MSKRGQFYSLFRKTKEMFIYYRKNTKKNYDLHELCTPDSPCEIRRTSSLSLMIFIQVIQKKIFLVKNVQKKDFFNSLLRISKESVFHIKKSLLMIYVNYAHLIPT